MTRRNRHNFPEPGNFKRVCDRSGFRVYQDQTRKEWTGLIVDERFWDPRHPQELIKPRKDPQAVKDARPPVTNPSGVSLWIWFESSLEQGNMVTDQGFNFTFVES